MVVVGPHGLWCGPMDQWVSAAYQTLQPVKLLGTAAYQTLQLKMLRPGSKRQHLFGCNVRIWLGS